MPVDMQAKLLRVLQERKVRPVGSDEEVPMRCRVIAATHRELDADVEAKRVPRGPLLPHQRRRDPGAPAARARAATSCRSRR